MFTVVQLERNAFIFRTGAFGETERDFDVASVGNCRVFTAHLQINIVSLAGFNVAFRYVRALDTAYSVENRVNGFGVRSFRNKHHLASFRFGEKTVAVFVLKIVFRKVGV